MGQRAAALNTRIRIHTSRTCSQGDTHIHTNHSRKTYTHTYTHTHTHKQTNHRQYFIGAAHNLQWNLSDKDIIGPE